jgi:hypothetical protein
MRDSAFEEALSEDETGTSRVFKAETTNFVRNSKAENYESLVEELANAYKVMDMQIIIKN